MGIYVLLVGYLFIVAKIEGSPCKANHFTCDNGLCIPSWYQCDGMGQCGDRSDENSCSEPCGKNLFTCTTGQCIPLHWRCNKYKDCSDASDESNCDCPPNYYGYQCREPCGHCEDNANCDPLTGHCPDALCEPGFSGDKCKAPGQCTWNEFTCDNGQCIPSWQKCDGRVDQCGDTSDELACRQPCGERFLSCDNGQCISSVQWCDGQNHCRDSSDEKHCKSPCKEGLFKCDNGRCISALRQCDGHDDCLDKSDERDELCESPCTEGLFACSNGRCISYFRLCDGQPDCLDASDEGDELCNDTAHAWTTWKNYEYYFSTSTATRERAREMCHAEGAELVTVHSHQEQEFIASQAPRTEQDYWIGLDRISAVDCKHGPLICGKANRWKWLDDSSVDYIKWYQGGHVGFQPKGFHKCVYMAVLSERSDSAWAGHLCDWRLPFICKRAIRGIVRHFSNTVALAGSTVELTTRVKKQFTSDQVEITWYPPDERFPLGVRIWQENWNATSPNASGDNFLNAQEFFSLTLKENLNGVSMLNEYVLKVQVPDSMMAAKNLGTRFEASIMDSKFTTSANLVILGNPQCPNDQTPKVDNDTVLMQCKVPFHGFMAPQVEWRDHNNQTFTGEDAGDLLVEPNPVTGGKAASRYSKRTLTKEDNMQNFYCKVHFTPAINDTVDDTHDLASFQEQCTSSYIVEAAGLWKRWENHEYYFSGEATTREKARAECLLHGAELSSVLSLEESRFLVHQAPRKMKDYWIGLETVTGRPCYKEDKEKEVKEKEDKEKQEDKEEAEASCGEERNWKWLDGSPMIWTHWYIGQPNGDGACAYLWVHGDGSDHTWGDADCETNLSHFICKRQMN